MVALNSNKLNFMPYNMGQTIPILFSYKDDFSIK